MSSCRRSSWARLPLHRATSYSSPSSSSSRCVVCCALYCLEDIILYLNIQTIFLSLRESGSGSALREIRVVVRKKESSSSVSQWMVWGGREKEICRMFLMVLIRWRGERRALSQPQKSLNIIKHHRWDILGEWEGVGESKVMICVLLLCSNDEKLSFFLLAMARNMIESRVNEPLIFMDGRRKFDESEMWKKETSFIFLRASASTTERVLLGEGFREVLFFSRRSSSCQTKQHTISLSLGTRKNCCDKFVYCCIIKFYCKSILIAVFFRRVSFLQPLTLLALDVQVFFLILLISAILSAGTVKVSSKKQQPTSIALSGLENFTTAHTYLWCVE